jgi:hypothetical protein
LKKERYGLTLRNPEKPSANPLAHFHFFDSKTIFVKENFSLPQSRKSLRLEMMTDAWSQWMTGERVLVKISSERIDWESQTTFGIPNLIPKSDIVIVRAD